MLNADDMRPTDCRLVPPALSMWLSCAAGLMGIRPPEWVWVVVGVFVCVALCGALKFFPRTADDKRVLVRAVCLTVSVSIALGCLSWMHACDQRLQWERDPRLLTLTHTGESRAREGTVEARIRLLDEPRVRGQGRRQRWCVRGTIDVLRGSGNATLVEGARGVPLPTFLCMRGKEELSLTRDDVVEARGKTPNTDEATPPSVGVFQASTLRLVERPGGWAACTRFLRRSLHEATSSLPGQARGLIPGMALGDDHLLPEEIAEAMKTASLTHLTAVSGTHICVLMTAVGVLCPGGRRLKLGMHALFLGVLMLLVGAQPSVIRAGATSYISVAGATLGREGGVLSALSVVVCAVSLIDPWGSITPGFVLSVIATWAVVSPARALTSHVCSHLPESWKECGWVTALVGLCCVPLCVHCAVLPVLWHMSSWLPTWGVFANIAVALAVAPATLLSLATLILAAISPPLAAWCASCASICTGWIAGVAQHIAHWPGARLPWHDVTPWCVDVAVICVLTAVVYVSWRLKRGTLKTPRLLREEQRPHRHGKDSDGRENGSAQRDPPGSDCPRQRQ